MVQESKITGKKREFKVSGSKIKQALEWLIANCPDYHGIKINEENLAQYPSDTGDIDFPSCSDEVAQEKNDNLKEKSADVEKEENTTKTDNKNIEETSDGLSPFDNDDVELMEAYEEHIENQGDIPKANRTVQENIVRETVDDYVRQAVEALKIGKEPTEKIAWPEHGDEPVSEQTAGYFTAAFPHLFPDGMGDITKSRPGTRPPMKQWVQHLLKLDGRFSKDPIFILVVTNILQKKKALALGNLYAERCVADMNAEDIKEKIREGDPKTLRSLYCYSNTIEGSMQMFSTKISMSHSFLRNIRIESEDKEMFNAFLTFSAADNHWDELHKLLPGNERYMGKKVVKDLDEIEESE